MMAAANDEWNGELTQFLDRLPPRPCLVPPPPSFCGVCGSINNPVARVCKFYPLRHERERGQTFIELAPKGRPDTFEFEIEVDFEEDEEEFPGAQMLEFSRPAATTAIKGKINPVATPRVEKPVEVEVYEAEVIEIIEEFAATPAQKPAPAEDAEPLARAEEEARRLEAEILEQQSRAERENEKRRAEERQPAEKAEPERRLRKERELADKVELERKARETPKPDLPKDLVDQVLSRDEEERLEREIEEELAKAGLAAEQVIKATAPDTTGVQAGPALPPDQVIAPIYSQPRLKIIPPEGEAPKAPPPLPPPPPLPEASTPPNEEAAPPALESPARAPEPEKPAPAVEKPSPKPAAPAPKEPSPAPGQRRTGGLYGIFRKAPKEQPKPDGNKNGVDDELAKRLKNEGK